MDFIKFAYQGTMRCFDGSLFDVNWSIVTDPQARPLGFMHPFVSGRYDPDSPFDTGVIGEIPNRYPTKASIRVPSRLCNQGCFQGPVGWWQSGWPSGTPGVVLGADGWAAACSPPFGSAYDAGYDDGYDSPDVF